MPLLSLKHSKPGFITVICHGRVTTFQTPGFHVTRFIKSICFIFFKLVTSRVYERKALSGKYWGYFQDCFSIIWKNKRLWKQSPERISVCILGKDNWKAYIGATHSDPYCVLLGSVSSNILPMVATIFHKM